MEWWKTDRASTNPSRWVTVTQISLPPATVLSMRLAGAPWR